MTAKTIQLKAIAEVSSKDMTGLEYLNALEEMQTILDDHTAEARKEWQDGIDRTMATADKVLDDHCQLCGCKLGVLIGDLVKHADTCPNTRSRKEHDDQKQR